MLAHVVVDANVEWPEWKRERQGEERERETERELAQLRCPAVCRYLPFWPFTYANGTFEKYVGWINRKATKCS